MYNFLRDYINNITSSNISNTEFKIIEDAFAIKHMKKKQFLLHEGSVCKYMGFITKGAFRQYLVDEKGTEHVVNLAIEGWWISDRESLTSETPSRYNIEAAEDADLLVATNEQLTDVKERSPLFMKMAHILDQRHSIASENRIHATISFTAEEKLIYLMKTNPVFFQRFPQTMLASYLGLTPETLSRVRKQVLAK